MPMIDVHAPSDPFPDGADREIAEDLTMAQLRPEGVQQPALVQLNNTAAYIHRLNRKTVRTVGAASARMRRMPLLVASILSLLAGVFASAQPIRNTERIDAVRTLLRSVETKDRAAQGVISSKKFIQHNSRIANGRGAFAAFLSGLPGGTTMRTARIFADGDYVFAQSEYRLPGGQGGVRRVSIRGQGDRRALG